ncbi:UDP-N-acetylglucosamine 2-epimerase [Leifsonia xyli subsp. cynodontis DSM 46306]|uniref:UDP-N-acetylglucosamine 2-epimerase domain-containing protein n=1 Tax=Leifsonia xyli subsp. cynodontis DSM 46306 TaxID=1389489 RepID=U3P4Z2_LEIXC|nr:UDP-N-acetylglucosamine 2-epimerase (non-hydrolyzing) [Leifsonia xyli]AGW40524.1 UDP-N-acetylglucosamine 2-epimerase [Leifsonia xyli subsp. cynodontis DSM 46306]
MTAVAPASAPFDARPRKDICLVIGTRPEIIKLAPVIRALGPRAYVIDSGQHYDRELSAAIYERFRLPEPDLRLSCGRIASRGHQIAAILEQLLDAWQQTRPSVVAAQGDTNTVCAAAQAAHYAGIPFVHVEAGLRSHDRDMPEEINRRVIGVLADVHCAPTTENAAHLLREGIHPAQVFVTGNTIVEACALSLAQRATAPAAPARTSAYIVATLHRPENTDDPEALENVLRALGELPLPVLFVPHPRTRGAIERFRLGHLLEGVTVLDPPDHTDFLGLVRDAAVVVSDSGGLQEECTVLKTPLVVVRRTTERPEAFRAGFARLVAPGPQIVEAVTELLRDADLAESLRLEDSPFGDGRATERITAILRQIAAGNPMFAGLAS